MNKNPLYDPEDPKSSQWSCPLSGDLIDGTRIFRASIPCGCVWSQSAFANFNDFTSKITNCPVCDQSTKFAIKLFPTDEEFQLISQHLLSKRKAKASSGKKSSLKNSPNPKPSSSAPSDTTESGSPVGSGLTSLTSSRIKRQRESTLNKDECDLPRVKKSIT